MPRPTFFTRLRKVAPKVNHLAAKETIQLTVRGTYGTYELAIGPEYSYTECKQANMRLHSRPMTLRGNLAHLFLADEKILPHPPRQHVANRMKATVIIRDVAVNIQDGDGDGTLMHHEPMSPEAIQIQQAINLAGERGLSNLSLAQQDGTLTQAAYQIIQDDIIASLRSVTLEWGQGQIS